MESKIRPFDLKMMAEACRFAANGVYRVSPNPKTAAILVKDGREIGRGRHEVCGQEHAEVNAIASAGSLVSGGDLYVTLEPCCHHGKTPPCTDLIIKSGIKRVFIGMEDPNPRVWGKGIKILSEAGLHVISGVMEKECRALNQPFIKYMLSGLPYITIKSAMTLDGFIADKNGESKWITSAVSRKKVHAMRADHDAVMVGMGTVLADDPLLTVRDACGEDAVRVVFDPRAGLPVDCRLVKTAGEIPLYIIVKNISRELRHKLEARAVHILETKEDSDEMCCIQGLKQLADQGIQSVFVEGGGKFQSLLASLHMIDRVDLFIAPRLLGAGRSTVVFPAKLMPASLCFISSYWQMSGPDAHFRGIIKKY